MRVFPGPGRQDPWGLVQDIVGLRRDRISGPGDTVAGVAGELGRRSQDYDDRRSQPEGSADEPASGSDIHVLPRRPLPWVLRVIHFADSRDLPLPVLPLRGITVACSEPLGQVRPFLCGRLVGGGFTDGSFAVPEELPSELVHTHRPPYLFHDHFSANGSWLLAAEAEGCTFPLPGRIPRLRLPSGPCQWGVRNV